MPTYVIKHGYRLSYEMNKKNHFKVFHKSKSIDLWNKRKVIYLIPFKGKVLGNQFIIFFCV
jgi:hypothetical protein